MAGRATQITGADAVPPPKGNRLANRGDPE
jgi:hypothetical protein